METSFPVSIYEVIYERALSTQKIPHDEGLIVRGETENYLL